MTDCIAINGVMVSCIIGINPEERLKTQPLEISLKLEVDTRVAARSGALADTVDYAALGTLVTRVLVDGQFGLLETALDVIARTVFANVPATSSLTTVTVSARKFLALGGNGDVTMTVTRRRDAC